MYRLLIVDDERYIVESMYELIAAHTELDLEILTTCYGDEALKLLNTQRIDIILLDINMPGLNGLEIAGQIQNNWPSCRIIFLTGYADFDYAYRSSQFKNTTFLLKLEDNDTILRSISDAIRQLNEEQEHLRLVSEDQSRSIYLNYLLYRDLLSELLLGEQLSDFRQKLLFLPDSFSFDLERSVFLLFMKSSAALPGSTRREAPPRHTVQLIQFFSACLHRRYHIALTGTDSSTFVLFLQPVLPDRISVQAHVLYIQECLNGSTSDSVYENLDPIFLFPNSDISWDMIGSTYSRLSFYYETILIHQFPQSGLFVSVSSSQLEELEEQCANSSISFPQDAAAQLRLGLQFRDMQQISELLEQVEQYYNHQRSMHQLEGILLYHELSDIFIEYILQHKLQEKLALCTGLFRLYSPDHFGSWKQVTEYFRDLAEKTLALSCHEEQDAKQQILERIRSYINTNLGHNLTLSEIAASVSYSSSHVSRFFHHMTGQTVSQYILQCRMEAACVSLTGGTENIQTISEKLGFENVQYFSNVFKKYTGMSPRDYRNQNLSGSS